MEQNILVERLRSLADDSYKEFTAKLIPGITHILGVRTPLLRKLATELIKGEEWPDILAQTPRYHEEKMLHALLIGQGPIDSSSRFQLLTRFIPLIDNWAVCDLCCSELKRLVKTTPTETWNFLTPYLYSTQPFEQRFGIVMLFHYLQDDYLERVLTYADSFCHEDYYARMGMAWLLSGCFVKYPIQTMDYLEHSRLDIFTYNKALQKIIESRCVDKATKNRIRSMKRRP